MNKILIIGSCGAGKSTFAKKLSNQINLPLVHLDEYYWKPEWKRTERNVWRKQVVELLKKEKWIMDGNYRNTLDIRLPASDYVIFLDVSRFVCFWRAIKRRMTKKRADKISGCKERMSWELAKWILWTFPRVNRKEIYEWIDKFNKQDDLIVLKNNKETREFLNTCKN